MSSPLSLGIDIGGTFTDLVIHDPRDGRAVIWKESTTPDDPARGALLGTRHVLAKAGARPEQVGRVVHATTLFTNALIERKGAKTGLLTTAGFRDVLEIGRERKYELYDLFIEMPKPLVARPWRREARERLAQDGTVEIPLDVDAALAEVADLVKQGVESLAICFLHAYANPAHERAIGAAVAERFQNLSISLSSDVAPEIREYLRASTTVTNAYVRPLAEVYLERLEQSLRAEGIPGGLFLMLSNGGLTHVSEAKRAPVQLLESGPAAGALAGAWFGRNAGLDRVLAFDMGGTTAKLALVDDGEPLVAYGFEAAREKRFLRGSGLPIQIATVELIEIGAGGGSIARKSELGMLMAPARVDRVASFGQSLSGADFTVADRVFAELEKEALDVLRLTGGDIAARTTSRLADMRYIGQGSEITVVLPEPLTEAGVRAEFEKAYKALFARTPPGAAIQFVAFRLSVSAPMPGSGS